MGIEAANSGRDLSPPHAAAESCSALLDPSQTFHAVVAAGACKARQAAAKIFLLGVLSGFYISFGGFWMLAVGGSMQGNMAHNVFLLDPC